MKILVLAASAREGGALSILKQYLGHLHQSSTIDDSYYMFVDESVDLPVINNVNFQRVKGHSWFKRLWFDSIGIRKWVKKNNFYPDVVISFQNTGTSLRCKHIVYFHQALVFSDYHFNPLSKFERLFFLYNRIYPLFVARSIGKNDIVVVQQPHLKDAFNKKFKHPLDRIHVLFPDVPKIDTDKVGEYSFEEGLNHFIYPAILAPYKRHKVLVDALSCMDKASRQTIRIHFTLGVEESSSLVSYIEENEVSDCFVFDGRVSYTTLLSMYKSSKGLLFPSVIETIGLPLIEAASFGLPILVSDLEYSREVLTNYDGASYIPIDSVSKWAEGILSLCERDYDITPVFPKETSDWARFINMVHEQ